VQVNIIIYCIVVQAVSINHYYYFGIVFTGCLFFCKSQRYHLSSRSIDNPIGPVCHIMKPKTISKFYSFVFVYVFIIYNILLLLWKFDLSVLFVFGVTRNTYPLGGANVRRSVVHDSTIEISRKINHIHLLFYINVINY